MESSKRRLAGVSNGSASAAKRPKMAAVPTRTCWMNPSYSQNTFQEAISRSWRNREALNDPSGAQLSPDPFIFAVLPHFVCSTEDNQAGGVAKETFLEDLTSELLQLKFHKKNNDLYEFQQSDNLKKFNSPCVAALRSMLHEEFLPWLTSITDIALTDTIDITCSKYEYTDVLLCHDDELEGRRIAFIFYLTSDWTVEDGGTLDLYGVDDNGQPSDIVKSLLPVWNNFVFFDVNAISFHQVSEIVNPNKTRLSINGWFHGPPVTRPPPLTDIVRALHAPIPMELEALSDWINPMYLDVGVHSQIQSQFEEDSQIELSDFLLEEKYKQLFEEMVANGNWTLLGAPNKRRVHVSHSDGLFPLCKALSSMLQSEPFCLLLSHLTGLDLADGVIRDVAMVNQDKEISDGLAQSCSSYHGDSRSATTTDGLASPDKQSSGYHGNNKSTITTNSLAAPDKQYSSCHGDNTSAIATNDKQEKPAALCRCDVYRWEHGDYTLAADEADPGMGRFSLEALLHFCSQEWSPDFGGVVSYIEKDVDEELLTIIPQPNALSLVYRDQHSLCFTKFVNHRVSCPGNSYHSNKLYSINATYIEVNS